MKRSLARYTPRVPCHHVSRIPSIYNFSHHNPYQFHKSSHLLNDNLRLNQERKANLGAIIDQIKLMVPNIVNKSLPKDMIGPEVLLRICPTHFAEFNAYLPRIKGHVSYYTTFKALQVILTLVVLNPKVQVHITSIRTTDLAPASDSIDYLCVYLDSTKIYVRWTTCSEGCFHLEGTGTEVHSTSDAKLGAHRWLRFDTQHLIDESAAKMSVKTALGKLTTGLIGLTKEENRLERVISGLFIFELNKDNSKIIVHTIEDVDVVERTEFEDVNGKLRVC